MDSRNESEVLVRCLRGVMERLLDAETPALVRARLRIPGGRDRSVDDFRIISVGPGTLVLFRMARTCIFPPILTVPVPALVEPVPADGAAGDAAWLRSLPTADDAIEECSERTDGLFGDSGPCPVTVDASALEARGR